MRHQSQTLKLIANIIGEEAMERLVEAFGGRCGVYIAKRARPETAVASVIGVELAQKLADQFGAGYVELPSGMQGKVANLILAQTGTNSEIARRLGCSRRYVRQVRNKARAKEAAEAGRGA